MEVALQDLDVGAKKQRNPMLGNGNGPINMCRQINMTRKYV
jgi:hypothetical protein